MRQRPAGVKGGCRKKPIRLTRGRPVGKAPAAETAQQPQPSLQAFIDAIPDPTTIIDREHRVVLANRAALDAAGGQDLVIGRTACYELYHRRHAPCEGLDCPLMQVVAAKTPVTVTHTHIRNDGTEAIVRAMAGPMFGPAGEVVQVIHSCRDVTSCMQGEQADRRLASIVEHCEEAILSKTLDGTIVSWNPGAERLYGYSADEIIGKNVSVLALPGRQDEIFKLLEQLGKGERIPVFETVRIRKDGRSIHVSISMCPITDENGNIVATSTIARDISKRKRIEDMLYIRNRILAVVNRHSAAAPLLQGAVTEIRKFTGCHAVGIHILDEHGNIPYQAYEGFSREFYEEESPLSIKSDQCMCINVIKAQTDPKLPFYTQGGSFYMNGTTRFLKTVSQEQKGQTRNVCNQMGYESVALIPIHLGGSMLGLIHVADRRENMVPVETVKALELAGMTLGVAIKRVVAEEALREAKEFSERLISSMQDGLSVLDSRGVHTYVNPAFYRMTGFSSRELIGKGPPFPYWPAEEIGKIQSAFQKMLRGEFDNFELTFMRKNGERFPVVVSPNWVKNASGEVASYLATIKDVTEQRRAAEAVKRAYDELEIKVAERTYDLKRTVEDLAGEVKDRIEIQEALQQSEEKYRKLFATVSDAIVLFDADTRKVLDVNDTAVGLYGYSREEFLNLRQRDITAQAEESEETIRAAAEGNVKRVPLRYHRKKDGTVFPVEISASSFMLGSRRVMCAVLRDITERMAAEESLRESAKLAATGRMAARIAHEINNPLGGIRNSFLLIEDAIPKNHPYHGYAARIKREIDRISRVVRQMFNIYRPSADKPTTFSIGEVVEDIVALLEADCRAREVTVITEGLDAGRTVFLRKDSLIQVLFNVLENAVEASPRGSRIKVEVAADHDGMLSVCVTDQGNGIPEAIQANIFEPFFTTKPVEGDKGGLGLGLPTSLSLVKSMGGSLDFTSETGRGTTFRITLPPPCDKTDCAKETGNASDW